MEEQETAVVMDALKGLSTRGRLIVNPRSKQGIEEAFAPLPPPWEWEHLREIAGLTAVDMARLTGVNAMRIRSWEKGYGTLYPELWLDYAGKLVEVVTAELKTREDQSLLGIVSGSSSVPMSAGVTAQLEQLHSTAASVTIWAAGNGRPPSLSPGEAVAVRRAIRDTITALRAVHGKFRPIAEGKGTGKEVRQ